MYVANVLPEDEIKIIEKARRQVHAKKDRGETISCPFLNIDKVENDVCRICHAWMKTDKGKYKHPCDYYLDRERLRRVFWRDFNI